MSLFIQGAIFILGLCGFLVARKIRNHKTKSTPLICMVGFDCHAVVHSDYSRFIGIPVEIFGMMYYALVSFLYFLLIFTPEILSTSFSSLLIMTPFLSLTAFLFSGYLIAVQIFILKKGCSWCIVSAIISALIFILILFSYAS